MKITNDAVHERAGTGGSVADFSLSAEEVETVCARMRANTRGVDGHVATAGAVEAGPGDFGGRDNSEIARLYARVLGEVIPASMGRHRDDADAMTDRLRKMLHTYTSGDEDAAEHLRRMTADGG